MAGKKIDFPYTKELLLLNNIFNGTHGDNLRIVGGAIRNFLLNKEISDFDLSTTFLPEQTIKILEQNNIKYFPIGIGFGTVVAVINNKMFEITTTREDIKTDGRHAEVKFTQNFEIDAKRRDFTFNALYLDFHNNLFDYFNGIEDLMKGIVRFIGNAENRIQEDYLRILRFFRFYCYYGIVLDNQGLKYSIKYKDKLTTLSGERIKAEMFKILLSDCPIKTLHIMNQNGILQIITSIDDFDFNKIELLYSIKKYIKNNVSAELVLTLLLKNIDELDILRNKWKLSKKENNKIFNLLLHKGDKIYNKKQIQELLFYSNDKNHVIDLVIINAILNDINNPQDYINNLINFIQSIKIPSFPINGNDLEKLDIKNKKDYGKIISILKQEFIESDFKLTKEELLNKADAINF